MARKLVVSDSPDRMVSAELYAPTAAKAIGALEGKGPWDLVSIHALRSDQHVQVLEWLMDHTEFCPAKLFLVGCDPLLVARIKIALASKTTIEEMG